MHGMPSTKDQHARVLNSVMARDTVQHRDTAKELPDPPRMLITDTMNLSLSKNALPSHLIPTLSTETTTATETGPVQKLDCAKGLPDDLYSIHILKNRLSSLFIQPFIFYQLNYYYNCRLIMCDLHF